MIEGSCHCGAVRFTVARAPDQVTRCNCSICTKTGSRMAYYPPEDFRVLEGGEAALSSYSWGDRLLDFRFCATCGCLVNWQAKPERMADCFPEGGGAARVGVNARLMAGVELDKVPVRVVDGANA